MKNSNVILLLIKNHKLFNSKKFKNEDWTDILSKQPQLINRCDKIEDINIYNWPLF